MTLPGVGHVDLKKLVSAVIPVAGHRPVEAMTTSGWIAVPGIGRHPCVALSKLLPGLTVLLLNRAGNPQLLAA